IPGTLKGQEVDLLENRLNKAFEKTYSLKNACFIEVVSKLNALSPTNVLLRGYSVTYKDKKVITSAKDLEIDDIIDINFYDGKKSAKIVE
ncbi:MAG: exodeoxyribonuclease VII large subunit, partial [Clostridia bacterium]|nr:exodeoxyribonuclease VII large subunit [Clostridia bacterium]